VLRLAKSLVLYLALSHVLFGFSLASKAYVKVLSLAFFSRAYVRALSADFYQPLFSLQQFPFNNSFPFCNSFPFQKLPTPKSPKPKPKTPQAPKALQTKSQRQKAKSPQLSFSRPFINRSKQGGAEALEEGCDIVTGETCVPASLKKQLFS
jgi:hypothetical protein